MAYEVRIEQDALRDLRKLDKSIARRILTKVKWVGENFGVVVPEPLTGPFRGRYRLRVGDYRVIYRVDHSGKRLFIEVVGHRRDVYIL